MVETGLDEEGRSTVASDRFVEARQLSTGRVLTDLWSADQVVGAVSDNAEAGLFPLPGGVRFWLFTVPAEDAPDSDLGLHATSTVDLGFVVAGAITMVLEDGKEVELRAGDAYVQNGTAHAWRNHGESDAVVALTVIGL